MMDLKKEAQVIIFASSLVLLILGVQVLVEMLSDVNGVIHYFGIKFLKENDFNKLFSLDMIDLITAKLTMAAILFLLSIPLKKTRRENLDQSKHFFTSYLVIVLINIGLYITTYSRFNSFKYNTMETLYRVSPSVAMNSDTLDIFTLYLMSNITSTSSALIFSMVLLSSVGLILLSILHLTQKIDKKQFKLGLIILTSIFVLFSSHSIFCTSLILVLFFTISDRIAYRGAIPDMQNNQEIQ